MQTKNKNDKIIKNEKYKKHYKMACVEYTNKQKYCTACVFSSFPHYKMYPKIIHFKQSYIALKIKIHCTIIKHNKKKWYKK